MTVKQTLHETEKRMKDSLKVLEEDLATYRTGRASPALVERVVVDYYGAPTPLNQLATISAPEPQLLAIRPFDPNSIKAIEKGILASNLGFTPNNDGKIIRISVPPLTEERRLEMVKLVKTRLEEAKVAVRNIRRDGLEELRALEDDKAISEDEFHRAKDDLQELTDSYAEEIDTVGERKESEIMEV
jgi:ribosome recycling factor